jgi:hypothetical protein
LRLEELGETPRYATAEVATRGIGGFVSAQRFVRDIAVTRERPSLHVHGLCAFIACHTEPID